MNKYLRYVVQGVESINKLAEMLCNMLLVFMILIVVLQVVFRYLLDSPISWTEEVAIFVLVWFGMLSVATALYRHEHMSISFIRDSLSQRGKYFLDISVQMALLIFSLNIMLNSTLLVTLVDSERLPASGILRSYLYLAPLIAGGLMVVNSMANILWNAEPNKHHDTPNLMLDVTNKAEG